MILVPRIKYLFQRGVFSRHRLNAKLIFSPGAIYAGVIAVDIKPVV
jgi:hypothetical protein